MTLAIETYPGSAMQPIIADIARLRTVVFREWPYLYDGDATYEESYLQHFASSQDAIVVVARAAGMIVGVATASPLAAHTQQFVPLFEAAGYDPRRTFYCGESVLLPAWRGQGIGHKFFDKREAHATRLGGFTHSAFCAVIREKNDKRRPDDYHPLDDFWMKRGYRPVDQLIGSYSWKEIGQSAETDHPMQFWMREL
ncbi:MAG: hypothetical protein RLZ98_2193 [Pseudomonadota bacterium]|jgi:GNAT superfamily N-acetyltransferase